jgi:hypothetical protein
MSAASAGALPAASSDEARVSNLRRDNLIVGLIHLVQAIVLLVLSNDFKLPITMSFIDGPPGTPPSESGTVWELPLGIMVAVFILFAAVDHLLMAAPGVHEWYLRQLRERVNRARWTEYSISSSLMIVLIAMITGVLDLTALIAIFGVNMMMIFFGLVMEAVSKPEDKRIYWWPFIFGSIAGAVPWIVIFIQVVYTNQNATGDGIPGFVYGILASLFLFFNSFAVNMVLQYKRVGPWKSYLFGERVYLLLSLFAKSALAWQVFANTLID